MSLTDKNEEKILWLAIKNGDESAFRQLFDKYYELLCGYALFYSQDYDTAKEIVADIFVKLWQKRLKIDANIHLKAYIFIAVKNHALNHIRQDKKTYSSIDNLIEEKITTNQNPHQLMVYDELERSLLTCVEALPDRQRKIFKLNRFENLSYKEIAKILDISPYTVQEHMTNALKRLKRKFKNIQISD